MPGGTGLASRCSSTARPCSATSAPSRARCSASSCATAANGPISGSKRRASSSPTARSRCRVVRAFQTGRSSGCRVIAPAPRGPECGIAPARPVDRPRGMHAAARRSSGSRSSRASSSASSPSSGPSSPSHASMTAASTCGHTSARARTTTSSPAGVSCTERRRRSADSCVTVISPCSASRATLRVMPGWLTPTASASSPTVRPPGRSSAASSGNWLAGTGSPLASMKRVVSACRRSPSRLSRVPSARCPSCSTMSSTIGPPPSPCGTSITGYISCYGSARGAE